MTAATKGQLEAERGASAELRRIVAGLVQRIPELEAPREPRDAPETVVGKAEGHEGPFTEEPRPERSWWRRWFGFE